MHAFVALSSLVVALLGSAQYVDYRGAYVVPTEWHPERWEPAMRRGHGVLVTVGGERAMFDLMMGHFSAVLVVDIDPHITNFHRANLQLLHALWDSSATVAEQRGWYRRALAGEVPSGLPEAVQEAAEAVVASLSLHRPRMAPALAHIDDHSTLAPWHTDNNWLTLRQRLATTPVQLWTADLTDSAAMAGLRAWVHERHARVGVVDLSNVIPFILPRHGVTHAGQRLLRHLSELPWADDGVVLWSDTGDSDVPLLPYVALRADDGYFYWSAPWQTFRTEIELTSRETYYHSMARHLARSCGVAPTPEDEQLLHNLERHADRSEGEVREVALEPAEAALSPEERAQLHAMAARLGQRLGPQCGRIAD